MARHTLADVARARGIELPLDRDVEIAVAAPSVGDASAPPDVDAALAQMARYGAAPGAVAVLWRAWVGRPLELGLAARDILASSLYTTAEAGLVASLRAAAEVSAPATAGFNALDEEGLATAIASHALGAYEVLRQRGADDVVRRQGTLLSRTIAFAHRLHLARLESLASYYLEYLFAAFGAAVPELQEIALGRGLAFASDDSYVAARLAIAGGTAADYHARVIAPQNWWSFRPAAVAATEPRTRLAEGEIGSLLSSMPFPYEVVDLVAAAHPDWRWGARVRASMHGRLKDDQALPLVDDYLARFGSDDDFWLHVFDGDLTRSGPLLERAIAEVARAPHVAATWRAIARLTSLDNLAQRPRGME